MWCGRHAKGGTVHDNHVYMIMNPHWEGHEARLPDLPAGSEWRLFADTAAAAPGDICEPGAERPLIQPWSYLVRPRSTVILVEADTNPG
jgi:isoamylase